MLLALALALAIPALALARSRSCMAVSLTFCSSVRTRRMRNNIKVRVRLNSVRASFEPIGRLNHGGFVGLGIGDHLRELVLAAIERLSFCARSSGSVVWKMPSMRVICSVVELEFFLEPLGLPPLGTLGERRRRPGQHNQRQAQTSE